MLIKEKISHGTIQTVCHLHNGMYHPIHLCHIWISFTLSPPLCYSLKISNFRMREKKILCIYVTLSVSRYVKGGRESYFQTHVFLNNPYWQSNVFIILFRQYYVVISDTMVYYFGKSVCRQCTKKWTKRFQVSTWLQVVFCVVISTVNVRNYENLQQFNTDWL